MRYVKDSEGVNLLELNDLELMMLSDAVNLYYRMLVEGEELAVSLVQRADEWGIDEEDIIGVAEELIVTIPNCVDEE